MTDAFRLVESPRSRLGRWAAAAAVVCVLHVGGAVLALMHWRADDDSDEATGAVTVELAALPAPARVDSPMAAYGPEQEAEKLTQQSARPAQPVEKDIPRVEPSPAPDPEVALPKPAEKEAPAAEARHAAAKVDRPREDKDAPATAPPRVDGQTASAPVPSPAQSAGLARAQAAWGKAVAGKIERYSRGRYTKELEQRGVKGLVTVRFRVDRSGQVVSAEILKSSGWPVLDETVLGIIRRASPLPVPSDQIADPMLENEVTLGLGMRPDR